MLRLPLLGFYLIFLTSAFVFASHPDFSREEDAQHPYFVRVIHKIIKNPKVWGAGSPAEFGTGLLRNINIQAPEHVYFEIHTSKGLFFTFNYPFKNNAEFYFEDDIRGPYPSMDLYISEKVLIRFLEYFRTSPFIYDGDDLMEQMTSKISLNYQEISKLLDCKERFSEDLIGDIINHPTTSKLSAEDRRELAKRAKEVVTFKKNRIRIGRMRLAKKQEVGRYSYEKMDVLIMEVMQEAGFDGTVDSHVWFHQTSENYKYLDINDENFARFWQATPAGQRGEVMTPKFEQELIKILEYYGPLTLVHEPYTKIFNQHPFFSSYQHNCATAAVEGIRAILGEPNFYSVKLIPVNGREFVHRFNEAARRLTR